MRAGVDGPLISVAEAHRIYRVPVGTLRRWAHEDAWTRYGGPRSRHWSWAEVQAGFDRRRADHAACA